LAAQLEALSTQLETAAADRETLASRAEATAAARDELAKQVGDQNGFCLLQRVLPLQPFKLLGELI
jgi:hypothetical protein